jgi:hypothetical protein
MSEEDLKQLKEDLKKEILNEITRKDFVKDNTGTVLRKEFHQMLYSKGYTSNYDISRIWTGMTTILRFSMGYRSISVIPAEKYDEAKAILFKIFNLIPTKEEVKK